MNTEYLQVAIIILMCLTSIAKETKIRIILNSIAVVLSISIVVITESINKGIFYNVIACVLIFIIFSDIRDYLKKKGDS